MTSQYDTNRGKQISLNCIAEIPQGAMESKALSQPRKFASGDFDDDTTDGMS